MNRQKHFVIQDEHQHQEQREHRRIRSTIVYHGNNIDCHIVRRHERTKPNTQFDSSMMFFSPTYIK